MTDVARMGMGVIATMLSDDGSSGEAVKGAIGKTISSVTIDPERGDGGELRIAFSDGSALVIGDEGQSCCEHRYMDCDDDLETVSGDLVSIEVRDGPDVEAEYGGTHEQQFLLVTTSTGTFTVCTHNEHNGYYGGFALGARLVVK